LFSEVGALLLRTIFKKSKKDFHHQTKPLKTNDLNRHPKITAHRKKITEVIRLSKI